MDILLVAVRTSQLLLGVFEVPSVVPGQLLVCPHHESNERTDSVRNNHLYIYKHPMIP